MKQNSIAFFEEYFDYMDDMTKEQFWEFMTLIRNLRFKGIDTKPEEVEDKSVRMAWRCVRPVVLKSNANSRYYDSKKEVKIEDIQIGYDDFNPEFSNEVTF